MQGKPALGPSFNSRQAVEDKAEWPQAIGHFMVAFNSIEQVIDMCIASFGSEQLYIATHDLMLQRRVKIAKALAESRKPPPELAKRCANAFDAIKQLADERNIIAHNAPVVSVYMDEAKNVELRVEMRGRRHKRERLLTIAGLNRSTEASSKLAMELLGLIAEVTGSSPELPRQASAVFDGSAFDAKE